MTLAIKKALVVDDSRLARIALSKLLQKREVEVDVVGTGTEALDYLRTTRPDVVFMDYMMPDMDGFEATRKIRALPGDGDLPVVMYTSQDSAEDHRRARELGIAGFLTKPSGEHSLDEVLRNLGTAAALREPAPSETAVKPAVEPVPARRPAREPATVATIRPQPEDPESVRGPAPVPAPAAPAEVPWDEIREAARAAAEPAALDAAGRLLGEQAESLRREVAELNDRAAQRAGEIARAAAADAAGEAARSLTESAAREAAEAVADRTARLIAESVAEETAARVGKDAAPEAAKRIMGDLRRDIRDYVGEMLAADAFREQVAGIVRESGLPRLQDEIARRVLPRIRDKAVSEAMQRTGQQAVEAASTAAADIAREAAVGAVEARLVERQAEIDARVADLVERRTGSLRRKLALVSVAGLLLIAGTAVLALMAVGLLPNVFQAYP